MWSQWSTCTKGCGSGGNQTRFRQCNQPTPKHGGKYCNGAKLATQSCNTDECPGMLGHGLKYITIGCLPNPVSKIAKKQSEGGI